LNPDLLDVVTLATILEKPRGKSAATRKPASVTDPELAAHILQKRIARLGKQIRRTAKPRSQSVWSEYARTATHYGHTDLQEKQSFVQSVLQRCGPSRVLDIGANTGTYSLMAADAGAEAVAIDADAEALDVLWRNAATRNSPITTLVANIARPTPAAGWRNREQLSLLDRLAGRFDMVLMLAVIHHFILREQVPLGHIADLCASLTRRWLALEWVPPSDPMFQEWLRGRHDLYGHLSEDELQRAFSPFFSVADRSELSNGRVLILFERIPSPANVAAIADDQAAERSTA
jgi:SAM-dependent methyltransferase